ncbi:MAG: hypothetical protein LBC84_02505 [Prevotellaceae bacterium]|jgi:hypothetical protein|nr:hypothetical protein [Prevotellaceae bacterium]
MKKLLVIGLLLSFGFSACDMFGPVPTHPACDYTYVQTFTERGGDILCGILPGYPIRFVDLILPGNFRTCIGDQSFIIGCIEEAIIENEDWSSDMLNNYPLVFRQANAEKKQKADMVKTVWVESTRPFWTLHNEGLKHYKEDGGYLELEEGVDVFYSKDGHFCTLTINGGDEPLFTVTWPEKVVTPVPFHELTGFSFPIPLYSAEVTINRIDPYFEGGFIFAVEATGCDDKSMYTGFGMYFTAPTHAEMAEYIAAEITKDFNAAIKAGYVNEGNSYALPLSITNDLVDRFISEVGIIVKWEVTGFTGDGSTITTPGPQSLLDGEFGIAFGHLTKTISLKCTVMVGWETIELEFKI